MPCRYDDFGKSKRNVDEELNKVTRYLCGVLSYMDKYYASVDTELRYIEKNTDGVLQGDIQKWWKDHKRADEARRKREEEEQMQYRLKFLALSKLTDEEKEALGL